jgi:hypothetical protein
MERQIKFFYAWQDLHGLPQLPPSILQTPSFRLRSLIHFLMFFLTNWVIKNFNMAALINTIEIKRELVLGLY